MYEFIDSLLSDYLLNKLNKTLSCSQTRIIAFCKKLH